MNTLNKFKKNIRTRALHFGSPTEPPIHPCFHTFCRAAHHPVLPLLRRPVQPWLEGPKRVPGFLLIWIDRYFRYFHQGQGGSSNQEVWLPTNIKRHRPWMNCQNHEASQSHRFFLTFFERFNSWVHLPAWKSSQSLKWRKGKDNQP